jgi:hypothetical protein
MKNDDGRKSEGAPERLPKAGVGVSSGVDGNGPKRFSVQRRRAKPGVRATSPIEDIPCEKIRGCSCRVGNTSAYGLTNVRYAPDSDQIPHRSEMTRWAHRRHPIIVGGH